MTHNVVAITVICLYSEVNKHQCKYECTTIDDVSLLAELLELLVPILETVASEAASLGLEVNWQKTKVQALGCREDMPLTIKVQGQDVMVVKEFCLPWLSYPLINRKHL